MSKGSGSTRVAGARGNGTGRGVADYNVTLGTKFSYNDSNSLSIAEANQRRMQQATTSFAQVNGWSGSANYIYKELQGNDNVRQMSIGIDTQLVNSERRLGFKIDFGTKMYLRQTPSGQEFENVLNEAKDSMYSSLKDAVDAANRYRTRLNKIRM